MRKLIYWLLLQIGENEQNDTIEVISPGDYYFRNGKHFFMYEEVMEGQKESTRNMIKVRDNYMELTKKDYGSDPV